jgi:primosomal protein N'
MQTVTVVPIVRLRRATAGWSYKSSLPVQPGGLVIVPFRGRATLGVVWDSEPSKKATEHISEVLTATPLVRAPHRHLIEWLAEEGICSLSTALYMWLPAALRGFPLTKPVREVLAGWDANQLNAKELSLAKQHAVLVPSRREQAELNLTKKYGTNFSSTFEDTTPAQEFATWTAIAQGQCVVATGRERSLYAPWVNLRHVTVIEPEDISYHTGQTPYLNLVDAARVLSEATQAHLTCRTNLPVEAAQLVWPSASGLPLQASTIELTDLRHERILNSNLITSIQTALERQEHVILLYNAHDRLKRQEDGSQRVIPGIETLGKQLATALNLSQLPPLIHLGTRSILTDLPRPVGLSAILSLDPLLGTENFSDKLHGWGDIGRLLHLSTPLLIQTWQPEHPLPQAVLKQQFIQYCSAQIVEAKEAALPPFSEYIVCALPTGKEGKPAPEVLTQELTTATLSPWQVSFPRSSQRRGKALTTVTLHAPKGTRLPQTLRKVLAALPRPWVVERSPWYAV